MASKPEDLAAIHERAARLQREGNLPQESQPGENLDLIGRGYAHHGEVYATETARTLLQAFGEHQLGNALSHQLGADVKRMAKEEGLSAAGTKAEIVSRITAKMTEGRYSANFERAAAEKPAKSPSPAARQSAALERARTALPEASEPQRLRTALMEAAAERLANDPAFAARVRARYAEGGQAAKANTKAQTARGQRQELPPLVPIRQLGGYREIDPFKPPDPHFIVQVFGHHQLTRALQDYTLSMLKDAAAEIERTHPGTKPASRSSKDAVIAYIVEHTPAD